MTACTHTDELHDLFDGYCPPPAPANRCCGADPADDTERPCAWGACVEWFCVCGKFTGSAAGPVGCPCAASKAWQRPHPEQRPKRSNPRAARYRQRLKHRRRRLRKRCRR